jgi:hypothetical protein
MHPRRPKLAGLAMALALLSVPLAADTIRQPTAEGRVQVIQREAIVISEDSSSIVYKHFDLKERRVVKMTLNQGSLPYNVERSNPAGRQQIVNLWRRFGFSAAVTDRAGKSTHIDDAYVDFYPPGGRGSLLESVPARTSFPLLLDNGGADLVDFADIARIDFDGDELKLTLTNGQTKQGKFLMPTRRPAEARLLGISKDYDPSSTDVFDFSLPLSQLKQVVFEH